MKIAVLNSNGVQNSRDGKIKHYYSVSDDYDFGGNSATDVTSITDLKIFYDLFRLNYIEYRDSLNTLYDTLTYSSLSTYERKVLCKNFIVEKSKRDVLYSEEDQKDFALDMQQLIKESEVIINLKTTVDDIVNDIESPIVGELSNYKELYSGFDGTNNGVWHKVTLNGVSPNSVVMVSVYNNRNVRVGGVREVGSTLDRKKQIKINSSFSTTVRVDENSQVEVYRQNSDITFFITAQLS